jgi:hypothetical protein
MALKNLAREKHGLPVISENPVEILSKMTPCTPPMNPVDLANELQNANITGLNNGKKFKKVSLSLGLAKAIENLNYSILSFF